MDESSKFIKENIIDPLLSITFLYHNEKIEKMIENPKVKKKKKKNFIF